MRIWPRIARVVAFGAGTAAVLISAAPAFPASALNAPTPINSPPIGSFKASAKIVSPPKPLQCVPYARKVSGISIRGDAWTWWRSAKGRYERGREPRVNAVLVMKKTDRLRLGHLAVVKRIVDERTIVVDQANWLNRGRIHLNTAVQDVSPENDWSAVRVWYTPGRRFGAGTYAAHGFIYAEKSGIRTAGPQPLPVPRRRPAIQASMNAVPRPAPAVASPPMEKPDLYIGSGRADPRIQPLRLKPRRIGREKLTRDILPEDERRG